MKKHERLLATLRQDITVNTNQGGLSGASEFKSLAKGTTVEIIKVNGQRAKFILAGGSKANWYTTKVENLD